MIQSVRQAASTMFQRGWTEGTAGNISIDVTAGVPKPLRNFRTHPAIRDTAIQPVKTERVLLITGAGSQISDVVHAPARNLLLIYLRPDHVGYHVLWGRGGFSRATTELSSHLRIYSVCQDFQGDFPSVIHAHPSHLIALSHNRKYTESDALSALLWSLHPEVKMMIPEGFGFVRYCHPGSKKLAAATARVFKKQRIAIWEKHGCIAFGNDVAQALEIIDVSEKAASIYFLCKSAGYEIDGLDENDLRELSKRLKRQ